MYHGIKLKIKIELKGPEELQRKSRKNSNAKYPIASDYTDLKGPFNNT